MSTNPKILLSAYQCGPGMGSVSQIGWQWYSRLSRRVPVTLVTHIRNQAALTAAGAPLPGSEVIYIDTEWLAKPLYGTLKRLFPRSQHTVFLFSSLDYFFYDRAALRLLGARRRHGESWDVVHVPTPVSPWASTLLYRLGAPLVLGPWNGGLESPKNFPEIMKADAAWLYPIRNIGKLINSIRRTTRNAAAILVANHATRKAVPEKDRGRCRTMIENAVDPDIFVPAPYPAAPSLEQPVCVAFVGRFIPAKGVTMLLEAAERFRSTQPIELTLVGEGPLMNELKQEAALRGLGDCVRFTGELEAAEVAEMIGRCHLFCLPSVRESGGAVLLEAMSCARPIVAVAYGGPAEVVDDVVGRPIAAEGRATVVEGLLDAFRDLAKAPGDWQRRGLSARGRALERYTWQAKIEAAIELYRELSPS